jgi:hypothetical protein
MEPTTNYMCARERKTTIEQGNTTLDMVFVGLNTFN